MQGDRPGLAKGDPVEGAKRELIEYLDAYYGVNSGEDVETKIDVFVDEVVRQALQVGLSDRILNRAPFSAGMASVNVHAHDAVRVYVEDSEELMWIPRSQLYPTCELRETGDRAMLIVTRSFAKGEGWIETPDAEGGVGRG